MAKKSSRLTQWACQTISAVERNFNAKASSKNPKTTFTVFIHPPDLGKDCSHPGKAAKSIKGKLKAREKPNMPMAGPSNSPEWLARTNKEPMSGPVQLKDTQASVKAI